MHPAVVVNALLIPFPLILQPWQSSFTTPSRGEPSTLSPSLHFLSASCIGISLNSHNGRKSTRSLVQMSLLIRRPGRSDS